MPLGLLVLLVAVGIAGIAVLLHLTGHSRAFEIDSEATARREWHRHCPEDEVRAVLVAANHRAALIEGAQGRGLLWSFGADTTAQQFDRVEVTDRPDGLILRLGSFTAPAVRLHLSPEERAQWRARLTGATP
ncbi:MAG: hypothetical protein GC186_18705 [Rhodobacteraceae bacterium]|nr:hypothetical protein [Paracoccaceae bacterium]